MGKTKASRGGARHEPLEQQMRSDGSVAVKKRKKAERERTEQNKIDEKFMSAAMTKKVLREAQAQQDELAEEDAGSGASGAAFAPPEAGAAGWENQGGDGGSEMEEADGEEGEDEDEEMVTIDGDYVQGLGAGSGLSAEDEALAAFLGDGFLRKRTLGEIIREKLEEQEEERKAREGGEDHDTALTVSTRMNPKVVKVYKSVGTILSRYRSGKLPKAFKLIPNLSNWEEVLVLTDPEKWTPAAMYAATRIFASNLNARMAQRFYNLILLPRVTENIAEYKKLNYHLYQALRKSLFRPEAFFRGILLPLCESQSCTLHEANIIGSVMAKTSIPVLHSAAAMLKIAELPYSGATSLFLRILIDKKYALPRRVLDALVQHFVSFRDDPRRLPVIWHQSLLSFAQRYKNQLSQEHKDALKVLMRAHHHHQITPEVRRELFAQQRKA